jgi:serine/threonine protein kinase
MDREFFMNKTLLDGKYKINDVKNYYIGRGAFGEVLRGINTQTKEEVAFKRIIKKKLKKPKERRYLEREIRIMVFVIRKEPIRLITHSL